MALPRRTPPPPAPPAGPEQYHLARLALRTLDAQQLYFRSKRGLDLCQDLERQLRDVARADGTDLAELVLRTLERQREYFRSGNDRSLLLECKQLERQLRDTAEQLLHPPQVQPSLFGEGA